MENNIRNESFFSELQKQHINDGGKQPDAFAITEVIRRAIIEKTYKHYNGGGYEYNTNIPILKYDVVVWFSLGGDPFFQLCLDNSEGDSCTLYNSNSDCEFIVKNF